MDQIMGLISKASVILAFVFISTLFSEKMGIQKKKCTTYHQIVQGFIFSIYIFIDMYTPYVGGPEISLDAREVLLNLSAIIYGPITATITTAFAFVIRWIRGTKGTEIALAGLALVYIWEILFLYFMQKKKLSFDSVHVWLFALVTNGISSVSVLLMSGEQWRASILPVIALMLVYPAFTLLAFKIMDYIKTRVTLANELSDRDKILNQKNRELQYANEELRRNELHFRTMFYHSSEAIFLMRKDEISDVNLSAMQLLGFKNKEDILGKSIYLFMPDMQKDEKKSKEYLEDIFQKTENGKAFQTEITLITKNEVELLLEGVFIEVELMDKKYIYLSARDIRERKQQEKEILYYAQHDALTKLANRQYFNETLQSIIEDEAKYPIAIMMADINGLKLTNDMFGHSKGDELIIKIAQVLSKSCRNHDLVARIGGDEFVIIFPNANEKAVQAVIERIKNNLAQEKFETICPSISMGYAVKESMEEEIDTVIAMADDMMYKNKVSSRQENARIFLKNILEYFHKKYKKEEEQSKDLLAMLRQAEYKQAFLTVYRQEVEQLILYYNIGKLILKEEDSCMEGTTLLSLRFSQKIIESSYSILKNIGEIKSGITAEFLVSINEHWDGSGFALGSMGEDIPYPVRIFKILYDIYYMKQNAERFGIVSNEDIARKMMVLSGKRYDPELVEKFVEILL